MGPESRMYMLLHTAHNERRNSSSPQQTAENLWKAQGLFCEGRELYKQDGDAIEMQEMRTGTPQLPQPPVGYTG